MLGDGGFGCLFFVLLCLFNLDRIGLAGFLWGVYGFFIVLGANGVLLRWKR